jgi:ribosome-associated translation inhibitor RaiA
MKNKVSRPKEVLKVKKQLRNMIPGIEKIYISTDKDEQGHFESIIRIPMVGKADLMAFKKGATFNESLSKAHQAIIRQFHKIKTKRQRTKYREPYYLQSA